MFGASICNPPSFVQLLSAGCDCIHGFTMVQFINIESSLSWQLIVYDCARVVSLQHPTALRRLYGGKKADMMINNNESKQADSDLQLSSCFNEPRLPAIFLFNIFMFAFCNTTFPFLDVCTILARMICQSFVSLLNLRNRREIIWDEPKSGENRIIVGWKTERRNLYCLFWCANCIRCRSSG